MGAYNVITHGHDVKTMLMLQKMHPYFINFKFAITTDYSVAIPRHVVAFGYDMCYCSCTCYLCTL